MYAQNVHRHLPRGIFPSGKRTIGSGASTSTGTHVGARKTASRPKRQRVVDTEDEHGVVGSVDAQEDDEREREQDPADRVTRATARDEQTDREERQRDDPDSFESGSGGDVATGRDCAAQARRTAARIASVVGEIRLTA